MIMLSQLNDFVFCPYSIYLHNIYNDVADELFHDHYQVRGKIAHRTVDEGEYKKFDNNIKTSLNVYSEKYGIYGIIDVYDEKQCKIIERKYQLKKIYQGQLYQLWGQYLCMSEMGYIVNSICFYETSTNKQIPIALPSNSEINNFCVFLDKFKCFSPSDFYAGEPNKCKFCVYAALCDKMVGE